MKPNINADAWRRLIEAGETPLTEAEIAECGLEEAPDDIGPSWREIEEKRRTNNGR